jgi:hypothetical protein
VSKLLEGALMAAAGARGTRLAAIVKVLQDPNDPATNHILDAAVDDLRGPESDELFRLAAEIDPGASALDLITAWSLAREGEDPAEARPF